MKYFIGIDGGGTKTKFVLADENGRKISESTQPTSHYLQCGFGGVTRVMRDGLAECLDKAGLQRSDITYALNACAGYGDVKKNDPVIRKAAAEPFGSIPFDIVSDTKNALAGALGGRPGINIIAGTGSVALGIDDGGRYTHCGGWHHIFGGDEGSAYWIAMKLILYYTRQSDGRDEKTKLYHYLNEYYGFEDDCDILALITEDWACDRTKLAAMAERVFELAKMGDPCALEIYRMAAGELAELVLAVRRSFPAGDSVMLSYTGGVFKSGEFILSPLRKLLQPHNIVLCSPQLPPDCGSVILAMKFAGHAVTDEIINNLRQ